MLYWFIHKNGKSDIIARQNGQNLKVYEEKTRPERAMARALVYHKKYIWDFSTGRGASTRLYWRIVCHNLSYFWRAIVNSLKKAGYTDATFLQLSDPERRGDAGEFDYIYNEAAGCYWISIYHGNGKITQILNGDVLTGDKGLNDIDELILLTEAIYNIAGVDGLTLSSIAYRSLKKTGSAGGVFRKCEKNELPTGETEDEYIRPNYSGGFNILKKPGGYSGGVRVLDVNSLYPYILKSTPLPYGKPWMGVGEPPADLLKNELYCGYIRILAAFQLKPGKIPFIKATEKRDKIARFNGNDVLTTSKTFETRHIHYDGKTEGGWIDKPLLLTLTFEEYALFFENYEVNIIEHLDYIYYRAARGVFAAWVDRLYEMKRTETGHRRDAVKLLLNGAIGSLSKRRERVSMYLNDAGELRPVFQDVKAPSHIFIGAYVVASARVKIIRDAAEFGDRFIYSDTDSIHFTGWDIPDAIQIGDRIGQYKIEKQGESAYYWGRKKYVIQSEGKYSATIAGLPSEGVEYLESILNGEREGYRPTDGHAVEFFRARAEKATLDKIRAEFSGRKPIPEPLTLYDLREMKTSIPVEIWEQSDDWKPKRRGILWDFDANHKNL